MNEAYDLNLIYNDEVALKNSYSTELHLVKAYTPQLPLDFDLNESRINQFPQKSISRAKINSANSSVSEYAGTSKKELRHSAALYLGISVFANAFFYCLSNGLFF